MPLSENTEVYDIEILDAKGKVLRTVASTEQKFTYSKEMQDKDTGFYSARIYQISETRGRGLGKDVVI